MCVTCVDALRQLLEEERKGSNTEHSLLSFNYYQTFFDVTTSQVAPQVALSNRGHCQFPGVVPSAGWYDPL